MKSFTARFCAGKMDLGVIVTPLEKDRKFKIQMGTNEPDPVILIRSETGSWIVENPGKWTIPDEDFQKLGQTIDMYLDKIYSMKTILVLTDFSDTAHTAARYAAALTHQLGASGMVLYHSYETPVATGIPAPEPSEVINFFEESLINLDGIKNSLQPFVNKKTTIEIQTDERPLVLAVQLIAEQQHAGLVVMGITGKSDLEKILIGSNTLAIAKDCSVPVLVVPKKVEFKKIDRILFACDLKEVLSTTPIKTIKAFIHALDAKLLILNVDRNEQHADPNTISEQSALHGLLDSENPEYHYIDHEDTAEGIMQFAEEHDIQLIITVPKKYGFFESLFHRSLTKKLAFHTRIPLLLLEEDL